MYVNALSISTTLEIIFLILDRENWKNLLEYISSSL